MDIIKSFNLFVKNKLVISRSASDRSKSFFLNTILNFFLIGLKLGINLLMFRLLLSYIEEERFGIWQTILSITSFVTVFTFGYPNGLRNFITKMLLSSSKNDIEKAIGSVYIKLSKITLLVFVLIIPIIYFFVDPNFLFFETSISSFEIIYSLLIFTSFLLLNNILNLSDSIAFGYQKSYLTSLFHVIYLIVCYLVIYFLGKQVHLNLIHISFIFGSTQTLRYVFFSIFQKYKMNIKINLDYNFSLTNLNKLSLNFFLAQLLAIIFLATDYFIISSVLGPEETTKFSIVSKIFFTLITLFSILLIHFWNSVTDAYEKREFVWIFKIIKILSFISIFIFIIGLIISFFQQKIINLWLGSNNLGLESLTFYLFSIYTFFHCINAIFLNLQNGLGKLKLQIYTSFLVLFLYVLGCYLIDVKLHGYNSIITLKIGVMVLSIILNSLILKKIR
ncbi:hypothetical protein [uncultured Polaribacter sp.]|uniref:hypothetical protein n=1 Tax=uncultured Polaribacter sp. TaxID=174711 RepID=UPI0026284CDA|nr:hypothetical protein [uncultured Polaribacter sp.]